MLFTLLIIAIFGIGCFIGWYKGFLNTLFNIISFFFSWLAAFLFHKPLSNWFVSLPGMKENLLYFTAGTEKFSDMTIANVDAATLSSERIHDIISTSNIPPQIANSLEYNILNQTFADQGIYTMGEYFNQTFINFSVNLICFLLIYIVLRIVLSFLIELADKTLVFPVLKKADSPIAALFGIIHGFMICTVIFSIILIVLTVIDIEFVQDQINSSWLANLFYYKNMISSVLSG